jgi:hypothetical protein
MPKIVMRGNEATALGAKLCRPNVIPAYPITPSTMFPERISEYVADGELDAEGKPSPAVHRVVDQGIRGAWRSLAVPGRRDQGCSAGACAPGRSLRQTPPRQVVLLALDIPASAIVTVSICPSSSYFASSLRT